MLADALKDFLEEHNPLTSGLYCDLIRAALSEVDWLEVANAFMPE